ncbi:unnamed protein product [Boreogadus saida]
MLKLEAPFLDDRMALVIHEVLNQRGIQKGPKAQNDSKLERDGKAQLAVGGEAGVDDGPCPRLHGPIPLPPQDLKSVFPVVVVVVVVVVQPSVDLQQRP